MLKFVNVSELFTKADYNELMGYSGHDVPKEDKTQEGYAVTFEGDHTVWIPKEVYEVNFTEGTEVSEEVLRVAQNPAVFHQLSPVKQKNLVKLVKEVL